MEKLGAIDIGSNAIRLSLGEVDKDLGLNLTHKYRIPLRLGSEAFGPDQQFSPELIDQVVAEFVELKAKMLAHRVVRYRAMATSACRDALNGQVLLKRIYEETGLIIDEITGVREAQMLLRAISHNLKFRQNADYLLFDLGGGSLELSEVEHGDVHGSQSFNLGTVRLLNFVERYGLDSIETRAHLELHQNEILKVFDNELLNSKNLRVIGTGGNFRRLLKLKKQLIKGKDEFITPDELNYIFLLLKKTTVNERIKLFKLRPDRAEVILPALMIIKTVIDKLPVKKIYAPKIGLIEGIFYEMMGPKELSYPLEA